ncbi:MAG: DUF3379 family protein [Proteobacteria bacterium]|nr:DUF3379 family protein [Pseudomonadota bacterium]
MNCEQARLLIGAEPGASPAALQEHLRDCQACSAFREEMLSLESRIGRALQEPPERVARPAPARRALPAWREWALAASIVLACGAVLTTWVFHSSDSLARDVVAHVNHEPDSWLSERHVDAAGLAAALAGGGVALELTSDKIMYAQSCFFHGHYVPHLVLQTSQGPATVLLLRHEKVTARRAFQENGMTGVIVPAQGGGGIAVLERSRGDVDLVAQQMQQDVRWLPGNY